MAWKTGYSYRQTGRIVKALRQRGILVADEQQPGRARHYHIDFGAARCKPDYRNESRSDGYTPDTMSEVVATRQNVPPDTAMS